MDLIEGTGPLLLGDLLRQYPNQLHLSLTGLGWVYHPLELEQHRRLASCSEKDIYSFTDGIPKDDNMDTTDRLPLSLRTLHINSLVVTPGVLMTYLARLEQLTELSLLDIRQPCQEAGSHVNDLFQDDEHRQQF